jgi:hypothetical protein
MLLKLVYFKMIISNLHSMHNKAISLSFLLIFSVVFFSCKSNKGLSTAKPEVIFSLSTTPCFGQCPVFELSLSGDKELIFKGKEHTKLEGTHSKVLTDEQFEAFIGIIEAANWNNLKPTYKSNMSDMPTHNYVYNRNGIKKSVSKYGTEPKELYKMSDVILEFVEEQIFKD